MLGVVMLIFIVAFIIFRFLKYRYNYIPPDDLERQVKEALKDVLIDVKDDARSIDLTNNRRLKFQVHYAH